MSTTIHGLFCDVMTGLEYIDEKGALRAADASTNADMFWMARGGGGNFPGIVTSFTVSAFPMPQSVHSRECVIPYTEAKLRAVLGAWSARLEQMAQPSRKLFTHVKMWGRPRQMILFAVCIDCTSAEVAWTDVQVDAILNAGPTTPAPSCSRVTRSWLQQLLIESGSAEGAIANTPSALLDRNQGWGKEASDAYKASQNGGHLGFTWSIPKGTVDAIVKWQYTETVAADYGVMLEFYPIGGPKVAEIGPKATAYKHRDAKWILHYKHQWRPGDAQAFTVMMAHHANLVRDLDTALPCAAFYNYLDNTLSCAADNDAWLAAHFSDVPRMKQIKTENDPSGLFRSRLPSSRALASPSPRPPPSPPPPPPPSPAPPPPPIGTAIPISTHARPTLPSVVLGMNYAPDPSDYTDDQLWPEIYYDSDYFNDDYQQLWGRANGGRGDLATMAAMGVNFVRLYDWNSAQSNIGGHKSFFDASLGLGIKVAVPISNYVINTCIRDAAWWCAGPLALDIIKSIVAEAYEHEASHDFRGAIGAWTIGNELDLWGALNSIGAIRTAIRTIVEEEDRLQWPQERRPAIMVPVSFAIRGWGALCPSLPGGFLCDAYTAVLAELGPTVTHRRYVHAVQSYNNGTVLEERFFANKEAVDPAYRWMNLETQFIAAGIAAAADIPTVVTEVGDFRLDPQAVKSQLDAILGSAPRAIGLAWFCFMDKPWKIGWGDWWEPTFGLHAIISSNFRLATTTSGLYLDDTNKPVSCGVNTCSGGELARFPVEQVVPKPVASVVATAYLSAGGGGGGGNRLPPPPPPPPLACLQSGVELWLSPPSEAKCCSGAAATWLGWDNAGQVNGFICSGAATTSSPPPPSPRPPPSQSPALTQPPSGAPVQASPPPPRPPPPRPPPPRPPPPLQSPPPSSCLPTGIERWLSPPAEAPRCCDGNAQSVWLGWNNNDLVNGFCCDLPASAVTSAVSPPPSASAPQISASPPPVSASPPPPPPPLLTPPPAEFRSQCSAHSKCAGLAGACCPTASGAFLSCCSNPYDVPLYDAELSSSTYGVTPGRNRRLQARGRKLALDPTEPFNATGNGTLSSNILGQRPWRSRFNSYSLVLRLTDNGTAPLQPPLPPPALLVYATPSPPALPPPDSTGGGDEPTHDDDDDGNGLDLAVIIGIAVAAAVAGILAVFCFVAYKRRSRNMNIQKETASTTSQQDPKDGTHVTHASRAVV